MKIVRLLLSIGWLCSWSLGVQAAADYILGPGDHIEIRSIHEDLTTAST